LIVLGEILLVFARYFNEQHLRACWVHCLQLSSSSSSSFPPSMNENATYQSRSALVCWIGGVQYRHTIVVFIKKCNHVSQSFLIASSSKCNSLNVLRICNVATSVSC
jgi:hypothetical protein